MTVVAAKEQKVAVAAGEKGSRPAGSGDRTYVHSQVRRILEEDNRIGEGTGEGLSAWDSDLAALLHLNAQVDAILCNSRPFQRSSPLGGKTAVGSSLR